MCIIFFVLLSAYDVCIIWAVCCGMLYYKSNCHWMRLGCRNPFRFRLKFLTSAGWGLSHGLLCNPLSCQALWLPSLLRRERLQAFWADSQGRLWVWRTILGWHIRLWWELQNAWFLCVVIGELWIIGKNLVIWLGHEKRDETLLHSYIKWNKVMIWKNSESLAVS